MPEPPGTLTADRECVGELALRATDRLGYQDRLISVGPVSIRLRIVGDLLGDQLLPAFARSTPGTEPGTAKEVSATIVAWDMTEAELGLPALDLLPRPGDEPRSTYVEAEDGVEAWFQPYEATISLYDHGAATGYFCVRASASLPPWESAAPLRALMRWVLVDHGLHLVHAAAVGDDRGALLLAARGGSGKSTSTALCAAAGMLTTGDDYVVLSPPCPEQPVPSVQSLYRTLKLSDGVLARRFAGLGSRAAGNGKRSAWIDELAPLAQVPSMSVVAVVVPSVAETATESSFGPLTAAGAIRGLGPSTVLQLPGRADEALVAMSALVNAVPAFEAQLGRDLDRIPRDLTSLLDRVVAEPEDRKRKVIVELRAGTGGDEASLFVGDLFKIYQRYADTRGWRLELMEATASDVGGFKELIFGIEGEGAWSKLRFESGGHRVQRVPETEAQGRIHTSAATVAVLPEAEEVDLEIKDGDLRIDTMRAGGAGGQHVNKTESAVRITHLPTGTVVVCMDDKSQHKNKARAMRILRARLYEAERERVHAERARLRKSQVGTGDRSDRVRTYNWPQNRMTDHRLGKNFSLEQVLAGKLDGPLEELETLDREERIKEL